jgi:hypothetical protein
MAFSAYITLIFTAKAIPAVRTFNARLVWGMVFVFLIPSLLAIGCRQQNITAGPKPAERYDAVMTEWTREARSYAGIDLQLLVVATYRSDPFETAYVSEYSKIHKLDPLETERMKGDQAKGTRQYYQFLVAAYVPEKRLDDFGRDDSIWRIYLTVDNRRIEPTEVKKMKFADAKIAHFFPYVTPWKSAYRIRFPKPHGQPENSIGKKIRLDIAGVAGNVSLDW